MFLNMIHPSFVSLKFQFQIHIYHNSLLICYKNLLIVKVFSCPLPVFSSLRQGPGQTPLQGFIRSGSCLSEAPPCGAKAGRKPLMSNEAHETQALFQV